MKITENDALLIVDVQNTFCPGGTLPVTRGDEVVEPLNRVMPLFDGRVFATQDWHPENHCSFTAHGGPWPVHAVQDTDDAALHPALNIDEVAHVARKGTHPVRESYSGFDGTSLAARLRAAGLRRVFIGGLATDYCVKATALDARREGFEAVILTDAVRAVNVNPGDDRKAFQEMADAGCGFAKTNELEHAESPRHPTAGV